MRIAQDYSSHEGKEDEESINRQCIGLRWQGPEDGWYKNYKASFFEGANQLITEACTDGFLEMGDQQLQQLCLEVLKAEVLKESLRQKKREQKVVFCPY